VPCHIAGTINFQDVAGTSLSDWGLIGSNIKIRVWPRNTAYRGTQGGGTTVAETNILNSSHACTVSFTITNSSLNPCTNYDLGVSASAYNDWKVLPVEMPVSGQASVSVAITFTNMSVNGQWEGFFALPPKQRLTYGFDSGMSIAEQAEVRYALGVWSSTGLVQFEPAEGYSESDLYFMWDHLPKVKGELPAANEMHGLIRFNVDRTWDLENRAVTFCDEWDHHTISCTSIFDMLWYAAVHEIGHALGLILRDPPKPGGSEGFFTSGGEQFSVMSYEGQLGWLGYSDVLSVVMRQNSRCFYVRWDCPVDVLVTDPLGRVISRALNSIPGASYVEEDFNDDGSLDGAVTITQPLTGAYSILVVPQAGADPAFPVTLTVEQAGKRTVLLDAVPVSALPGTPFSMSVDREPPSLTVTANPSVITGADGRMVPVSLQVQASDALDTNVVVALLNVSSSDGWCTNCTDNPQLETDVRNFQLCAAANGATRTYTISYGAQDSSGNVAYASAKVLVIAQPNGMLLEPLGQSRTNPFAMRIYGTPGVSIGIESSANLRNWGRILTTNLANGTAVFTDTQSQSSGTRFYRAVWP
jgi:hypothetical protein